MPNKLIFITGVGVGYVLGTRAGRERFDQIVAQARKFWESPTVQEAAGVVQAQATKIYDDGKQAVTDQVHRLNRKSETSMDEGAKVGQPDALETSASKSQFSANSF
jgi:hypothetical protein